ncbi:hypothetical protein CD798_12950 [Bacillaceae bacterium SAOS 7]|nr:hypothetical protein CD798_12950 [Bacillaceae bacterium SAOS 7]
MKADFSRYQSLKNWRSEQMFTHQSSTDEFNYFHELVMNKVVSLTIDDMVKEHGPLPGDFSWFVMGSIGRYEQAVNSDQDHGLVFENNDEYTNEYFLTFGKRLCVNLQFVGYPYCIGNVMSSNPLWCQSIESWERQLDQWLLEESWESIRYLLIFYDARVVVGEASPIQKLKQRLHQFLHQKPHLLNRFFDNTSYMKKGIGVFGQFLTESNGPYKDCLELKHTAFFPYVNSIRLLAIKENLEQTSTLSRIHALSKLPAYNRQLEPYADHFDKLLSYRLQYADGYHLNVKKLNKIEKLGLKQIILGGRDLQRYAETTVKRVLKNEI